jgi:hypothetical protein
MLQNGNPVASGLQRCITGLTRNPSLAKEAIVNWDAFSPAPAATGDVLSLRISTRVGTTPAGAKCAGPGGSHNNARGLRLYYDSTGRPSRFDITIDPAGSTDEYLHSDGGTCPNGDGDSPGHDPVLELHRADRLQPQVRFGGINSTAGIRTRSSAPEPGSLPADALLRFYRGPNHGAPSHIGGPWCLACRVQQGGLRPPASDS